MGRIFNVREVNLMQLFLCAAVGFFFGSINPAFIISKIKGFDIRERGSGNAGASNVAMTLGKKAGLFTALFDIFKAAAASLIAAKLFPQIQFAKVLAGTACILGHIFPPAMGFHGGKGLACLGGMVLAYDLPMFSLLLVIEAAIALTLDYVCVIPISGSLLFTLIYAFSTGEPVGTVLLSITAMIMLLKHIQNLRRIQNGTETHISFLWKKSGK